MPRKTADKEAVGTRLSRRAILAMVALCTAVFVAALDQTMVYTIMKDLMATLSIPIESISRAGWIITGYLLGYTVAMPLFGSLADVRGRRSMAIVALGLFLVGSALCVFLRRLDLFVIGRVIQAAGGGALVPIAMAAAADMFPLRRRALVLGIVGGAAEGGGVLGPLYGVALASLWYWPLIFIVNIPLSLLLMVACWRWLRDDLKHPDTLAELAPTGEITESPLSTEKTRWWKRGRVDYGGAGLMALALAAVTVGLGTGSESLDTSKALSASPINWPWLVVGAVAIVGFLVYERFHPRPLVRLAFFKKPAFAAANIAFFLVGVALMIGMAGISLYAQTLFGLSEWGAGLLLVQLTLPIPVGAVLGGWLADLIGCKITAVVGFLAAAAGYFLVSRWPADPTFYTRLLALVLSGLGFGFVIGPIGTSVTSSVGQKWMATGSALVTVSRMIGMAVGLSAISSWGVRRVVSLVAKASNDGTGTPYETVFQTALHQVFGEFFLIAAVVTSLAVIPALFFYNHRERGAGRLPFLPS